MHQVFVNKKAVQKLWCQCIRPLIARKQFISCGFYASCLSLRKQFKSCGIYTSCVCQLGRSLKVAVSMHRVFVNKEAAIVVSMHQVVINKEAV